MKNGTPMTLVCRIAYVKSKKLTFRIEIVGPGDGSTQIHIGAQKHMWYGWKRDDNRELYYTPRLSNMYYQGVVNGHLVPFPQAEDIVIKAVNWKLS